MGSENWVITQFSTTQGLHFAKDFLKGQGRFAAQWSELGVCRNAGNQSCSTLIAIRLIEEKQDARLVTCYRADGDKGRDLRLSSRSRSKRVLEPARVSISRADRSRSGVASSREENVYGSRRSRSVVTESRPPLTREEEHQFFSDVQDLLHLENIKAELARKLGRDPTYQEWADCTRCSVCRLYARIGKGRAAKRKMIAANLPLVSYVAKQFLGRGLSYHELCQEGALGLLKSTERFDISHDTKFSTYSFFWIRERMSAAAKKFQRIWVLGKSIQKAVSFVLDCKDEFREVHGRNPTINELAFASKIDKYKIRLAFCAIRPAKVLSTSEEKSGNDGNKKNVLYREPEDPESDILPWLVLRESELKTELRMLFLVLSPRELQVLNMRYGLYGDTPLSLVQIAAELGVSHETARMAEKNALRKLRRSAEEQGLQQYLPKIGRLSSD